VSMETVNLRAGLVKRRVYEGVEVPLRREILDRDGPFRFALLRDSIWTHVEISRHTDLCTPDSWCSVAQPRTAIIKYLLFPNLKNYLRHQSRTYDVMSKHYIIQPLPGRPGATLLHENNSRSNFKPSCSSERDKASKTPWPPQH
jgi:hypothetical protein